VSDETYDSEIPGQQHLDLPEITEVAGEPDPAYRHSRRRKIIAGGTLVATGLAVGAWGLTDALAGGHATHGFPHVASLSAAGAVNASDAAAAVDNAVVDIDATDRYSGEEDAGTGMVITSGGVVLTNNHVVRGATSVTVTLVSSGRSYHAKVIGTDATDDVALVKIQGASGLSTISAADASAAKTGTSVAAIGNALGRSGTPTVTTGKITGTGRTITASDEDGSDPEQLNGMLEIDAEIVSGDSGGPLVDSSGQVIGMDTAASSSSGFGADASGVTESNDGYAIPITTALSIAKKIAGGKASSTIVIGTPGFLGVELGSSASTGSGSGAYPGFGNGGTGNGWPGLGSGIPGGSSGTWPGFGSTGSSQSPGGTTYGTAYRTAASTDAGLTVLGVVANSPAAKAGISEGDTISSINGTTVTTEEQLTAALDRTHGGDRVTVGWTDSSGGTHQATVTLIDGPAA